MLSPFASAAPPLRKRGYSVIPLVARKKHPFILNWSQYCSELADDAVFEQWLSWHEANVGVCLGRASGITALDFDSDADGTHKKILRIIPDSPVKKAGKLGFTAFYRFGNERSASFSIAG